MVLIGLWRLSRRAAETKLRCAWSLRIYIPSPNILAVIVSETSAFIRTETKIRKWLDRLG